MVNIVSFANVCIDILADFNRMSRGVVRLGAGLARAHLREAHVIGSSICSGNKEAIRVIT